MTSEKTRNKRVRGNGQGCAYKESNGKWTCKISIRGRRYVKKGFKTKKEALEYVPALRAEKSGACGKSTNLNELYESWKKTADRTRSKSQMTHLNTAWARLEPISCNDIRDLSIDDLQSIIDKATGTFYPARDMRDLLSMLYERAIAEQSVSINLSKYIILPEKEEKHTVPFNEDEIRSMWSDYAKGNRFTGLCLLMIYTGMMPGELRKLEAGMFDLSKHEINGAGIKTEIRKNKPIFIPDIISDIVNDILSGKKPEDRIYPHTDHYFLDEFSEMKTRCGIRDEIRPYSCRHTTATALAAKNVSAAFIKEIMRHSTIVTSQRYIHVSTDDSIEMLNKSFSESNSQN